MGIGTTSMLSRPVSDAARALAYLDGVARAVVEDVSRGTGLCRPSLAKLMGTLVRKGFVTTRRGLGGGAALARPGRTIRLLDLCLALDDPILAERCLLGGPHSAEVTCPARRLEGRHHRELLDFLSRTSVVDAAAAFGVPSPPRPHR
jgi:Rrf2 family protein